MYDLRREMDTVNPHTEHRNIMLLAQNDDEPISHPFCYARVLGIYRANDMFTGPESRASGKKVFVINSFTSTKVTLWGYEKITSIKIVFCSFILGVHNIGGINDTIWVLNDFRSS